MIHLVAIDDEQLPLELVQTYSLGNSYIKSIHTFNKLQNAQDFIENSETNVLLLDVEMPQQNGIEFYNTLIKKPLLILATAYPQYALQGFQAQAIAYLLKPFSLEEFDQVMRKANTILVGEQITNKSEFITISIDYSSIPIHIDSIVYIESFGDFISIHTTSNEVFKARHTMKALLLELPAVKFVRVHRSYIVAIAHIKSIRRKIISIAEVEIPIGGNYEKEINKVMKL
jgi:DNA-binding LytR/AlgR family response regulator